ncbi:hypothetical protein [Pseudomonas fragariae (ex Marin et al. 2024)]|uniref:hypothetical protein n=1 Tax=Pseudomonas fragariae (ex Marin et al. 2024) TaxID=3080056 RepID=UPI003F7A8176
MPLPKPKNMTLGQREAAATLLGIGQGILCPAVILLILGWKLDSLRIWFWVASALFFAVGILLIIFSRYQLSAEKKEKS